VMVCPLRLESKLMVSPAFAAAISARSVPLPKSAADVTVSPVSRQRCSSVSTWAAWAKKGDRGSRRRVRRFREGPGDRAGGREKNDMIILLSGADLRENDNAIVPGAQTVRRVEGRAGEGGHPRMRVVSARPHRPVFTWRSQYPIRHCFIFCFWSPCRRC